MVDIREKSSALILGHLRYSSESDATVMWAQNSDILFVSYQNV